MDKNIVEQLYIMAALQKTENAMSRIDADLSGVEAEINELGKKADVFGETAGQKKTELNGTKKLYRDSEAEVKEIDDRVIKNEGKLRSVKTNKEYQSLLKEIDDLKAKRSQIEDGMLQALEIIETMEAEVASLSAGFAQIKSEIEEQQANIRKREQSQQQVFEQFKQERDSIWTKFDPKLQKLFEKVKRQGKGIAMAAISDGVCQVCRMNIPPQMVNDLLKMDSLRHCPYCQRIIYPGKLIEEED
ncbi:MAG: hypothetical protein GY874_02280 [Desulfobacteraceae bacterium]|nr:hypothetical protein [Desulfobacteraceae bacterium]